MVMGDFAQGTQVVVIGGGTGGYVAAIRAAQLGLEVTLIEKTALGGVCLNWGCIPSKALIHVAGLKKQIEEAGAIGLVTAPPKVDLAAVIRWKDTIVDKLRKGIESLLANNGVTVVHGSAQLTGSGSLSVETERGVHRFEFEHAILATGSTAAELPGMPRDGRIVIDSTDALQPESLPERLAVIGAGAVGLELGIVYAKLGTHVTMLEGAPKLLSMLDRQIPPVIEKSLKRMNIDLAVGASVKGIDANGGKATVRYVTADGEQNLEVDRVLVAVGRRPNTSDFGLDKVGVKLDKRGFVEVNERMETSVRNIFAVGDMVAGPMLAHRASYQGKVAAEVIAGQPSAYEAVEVPSVIFSDPEIATVGLTEEQAAEQGIKVRTGVFPFKALGRTLTLGEEGLGFSKVVSDEETGRVLGVHIVGPSASDLIAEGCLAVASAAHYEDLTLTMHAHPTLPESIEEAAEQIERHAIHIFNPGKAGS